MNGVRAPLFYASPTQINAQFPVVSAGLTSARVEVEVQRTALASSAITVQVAPFSPGIFTWNQNGSGPGAILRADNFSKICPWGRTDCPANHVFREQAVAIYNGTWPGQRPVVQRASANRSPDNYDYPNR